MTSEGVLLARRAIPVCVVYRLQAHSSHGVTFPGRMSAKTTSLEMTETSLWKAPHGCAVFLVANISLLVKHTETQRPVSYKPWSVGPEVQGLVLDVVTDMAEDTSAQHGSPRRASSLMPQLAGLGNGFRFPSLRTLPSVEFSEVTFTSP